MRTEPYIGLFRAFAPGNWHVTFPELPECEVKGTSFKEVVEASRQAVADCLSELEDPLPARPRSMTELLIDAQRDTLLGQQLVHAVMHPVQPAEPDDLAPLDIVAARSRGGGGRPLGT